MTKVCFVSFEIYPTTWGGEGVLISSAIKVLLKEGHEVILLLDIPACEFRSFISKDRAGFPNNQNLHAYQVDSLCSDLPYSSDDFISLYAWNAFRFHYACNKLVEQEQPDFIEFFDYSGAAYYALTAKLSGLSYASNTLGIRLHSSNEVMDVNEPRAMDFEYYTQFGLEHHALRLAETIVYPSERFLLDAYLPHYPEKWYGRKVCSAPPVIAYPQKVGSCEEQDIILFYGRLYSLKGVDKFVDAAILLLSHGELTNYQFYIVGPDSMRPPSGIPGQTYQDYLIKKIPPHLRDHFKITGALNWEQFGRLLPRVLFAVFPNYFESFCYAAHELYAAGIPLIVSNIPAFQDYFQDEKNSLVFDGSVDNLAHKMKQMASSAQLREKLTCPYPIDHHRMAGYFQQKEHPSWMERPAADRLPSLLICVLDEAGDPVQLSATLTSLSTQQGIVAQVLIFTKAAVEKDSTASLFAWLGGMYQVHSLDGSQISPMEIRTADTLLILKAGDVLKPELLQIGLQTLARFPEISFVGSWREINQSNGTIRLETFPFDAMLEIAPFLRKGPFNRIIMRTKADELLIGLFDSRAGRYGEMLYLWLMDDGVHSGLIIPKPLLSQPGEPDEQIPEPILAYFVVKDQQPIRQTRLARYSVPLSQGSTAGIRSESPSLRGMIRTKLEGHWFTRSFILKPALFVWRILKKLNRRNST